MELSYLFYSSKSSTFHCRLPPVNSLWRTLAIATPVWWDAQWIRLVLIFEIYFSPFNSMFFFLFNWKCYIYIIRYHVHAISWQHQECHWPCWYSLLLFLIHLRNLSRYLISLVAHKENTCCINHLTWLHHIKEQQHHLHMIFCILIYAIVIYF